MIEIKGIKLYNTEELCEILKIYPNQLSRLRKSGKIRSTKIGRCAYTSEEALNDFLNGITRPQNAE